MTVVNVSVKGPGSAGLVPASGYLRWKPTTRRLEGASLVLPQSFTVPLVDGVASVDVEPTDSLWVWSVLEVFTGVPSRRRYFQVPADGPVDYTALVEVDPLTLDTLLSVSPDPDNPGFYLIGV